MRKHNLQGNLMLLVTAVIWGAAFAVQSMGMDYLEPFTFNGIRTAVGGAALIPVYFFLHREDSPRENPVSNETIIGGIACGACLFMASSVQQIGLTMTTAGKAGFITALYVLLVPILGIILRRKTPKRIWICVLIAVLGFYLLCVKEGFSVSKGDLLCLASSFFFSLHIMVIDTYTSRDTDPVLMSCIQFFVVGILSVAPAALLEKATWSNIFSAKWAILYTGVISAGVGYTLQIIGQKRTAPAAATLILSMESVFAAVFGWIFLGERLSAREIAGCALVFSAVLAAQLAPQRKNQN